MNKRKRLNWVDWAKTFAISFVVFGHIPENENSFLISYIIQFHMPFFFFISGYLSKNEGLNYDTFRKYWHSLILPYFIYNFLFYPYWIIKHIHDCPTYTWSDFIKPLVGVFLFQLNTPISVPLNGVTWFIIALLLMKIILAVRNRYTYGNMCHFFIFVACIILYPTNEFYRFSNDLVSVGFFCCFPFFCIGYFVKQKKLLQNKKFFNELLIFCTGIVFSVTLLILIRKIDSPLSYGIFFWFICSTAISSTICLSKLLDPIHSLFVTNVSIGTIVIMGLHWMFIGVTNKLLSVLFRIEDKILYPWYFAIMLTILLIILMYPIIIMFKERFPFMLGKRNV